MMKTLVVVVVIASCLVAGIAGVEETTEWEVEWTTEPAYNLSGIEPFTVPGFILPNLNISDIISTVGMMYQAEDVVHAVGSLCIQMGPRLNWLTGGVMQEICDPVLEALRNGSYAEAYAICESSWSFIESLFGEEGGEDGEEDGEHDGGGEEVLNRQKRRGFSIPSIDIGPLPEVNVPNITIPFQPIPNLDFNWTHPWYNDTANVIGNIGLIPDFNRNWSYPILDGFETEVDFPFLDFPDQYEICSSLAGLIHHNQPNRPSYPSVFDLVLRVIVAEQLRSIPDKCLSLFDGDEEEGSGEMEGEPFFRAEPDPMIGAFAMLGGFDDIQPFCNVSSWALLMRDEGEFELFNELVNQITTSIYSVITNRSRCVDFAHSFHDNIGLAPGNFSSFTSNEALCDEVLNAHDWRGNISEIDFYHYGYMDDRDAFIHLLSVAEILSRKSDLASLEFLCRMSPHTDDRFCTSIAYNDYSDVSKERIIEQCLRFAAFDMYNFDFIALLQAIGAEFDFDFYDSFQTCSHFTDIIFNTVIRQEYTIQNVLLKGMKVFGRVVSPMFCDLQSFRNGSQVSPEPACEMPGRDCFNWTSRGEGEGYERFDVGFVIGSVFSYLGGYRDGDHLCHQMSFALDDDALLDMVAGKLRDSVFRLFDDVPFCSDMIDLISKLMGVEGDVTQMIGFNNTGDFCGKISQIYNEGGNYNVSFYPLLDLFATDGNESEEYVEPHDVMHATVEMIKFAAMVMQSNDIGDALSKSCHMWQASGLGFTIFEVDDLCKTVLALNPDELNHVCLNEIIPFLEYVLHHNDEREDEEDEIDFDVTDILDTVGDEFGFDFHDPDQSCSHLTNILFNETISQEFPIDSVVVGGMRVVGQIISPIFCDFESFDTSSGSALEAPCVTPGQNCFDWSSRGEDFFYEREDIGFVVGTIFSYLGGYRDGDHLCHQMAFALEDDAQLDAVATKLKDSVFRFFEDPTFCPGTMDLISKLVGVDEDVALILGFETADAFCAKVNQIYNENGDFAISLEPLLVLLDSGDVDGDFEPVSIMNTTIEMIKFVSMIMHSDHIGDAISKTCHVWQESAGMMNIPEIDDICQMVLDQNPEGFYQSCIGELFPVINSTRFNSTRDDKDDDNIDRTPTFVDLSTIEICLDNGNVTFQALEDLDIMAYVLHTTHNLYNLTMFDENHICRAVTNVVDSRKDIPTLISEFAVEWMTLFMPLGAEICSCWDQVFHHLFEGSEDSGFGVTQFNEIVLIAVNSIGLESHTQLCHDLMHLTPNNMSDYAQDMITEILDFTADPEKCACTAHNVLDFILPLVNMTMEDFNEFLYQYLGFHSVENLCSFVTYAFSGVTVDPSSINCDSQQEPTTEATTATTQSPTTATTQSPTTPVDTGNSTTNATTEVADEECFSIVDCDGVCGGDTIENCAGVCGGTAVFDCFGDCNGDAVTNDCGYCVVGNTGRGFTFGTTVCGTCLGETLDIDCNGDCNGTAYRDACQVCVGGLTSVAEDVSDSSLDCLGVCNGVYVTNDCDECVQPKSDGTVFSTRDCNGDCNGFADTNDCGYCVGGNSGNEADTGLTACGVCNSTILIDPLYCLGCDDVAYSGVSLDACGVCDGDGSTCFTVDSIAPDIIPANTEYQIKLRGAGFQDATTKQCKFVDSSSDEQISVVDISNEVDDEFNCTANLPAGTYSVYLSTESTERSEEFVTLYVYGEITVGSISATEFDIDDSVSSISVNMTSSNGAFTEYKTVGTPRAVIVTDTESLVIDGTFGGDNDEIMVFAGPMLTTSAQVAIYPSFNGIDYLVTPDDAGFTITFYAAAPVAQDLKFSPTGHILELEFDVAINEEAVTSCDAIFMNSTSLGAFAQCYAFPFLRTIYILPSSLNSDTLIEPGNELVLRSDVLKKRSEGYARYASGTLTASSPDEAVTVYAVLTGTEAISSCGDVRLSALQSFGNAGRDFTYQWSVTSTDGSIPTGLTDDLTAAADSPFVTLDGAYLDADTAYMFSVTAENFLGGSDTKTLQVTRSALNKPDVVIYPERVDPDNALVSQSFYLRASVKFYEACGGAEQMEYSWSVDDDTIALNLQTINKPLLYVAPGSLPGNSEVTFTLEVNRASDPSTVTTQTVIITTVYTDLVALIDGGSERTIGVDSASFTLDGSSSYDPDNENEAMSYLWTCQVWNADTSSYEPCVSSATREVFPAEADSKASTLTLDANNLYSDSTYLFTLEMTKVSRVASTSVTILATAGNPPTISLGSALADKIASSSSHTLQVFITHTSDITIEWASVDTDLGNGYVDFSQLNSQSFLVQGTTSPFSTYAFVTIPVGTLEEGVAYSFSVTVTDAEGQVSASKLTTSTYGGVSSCTFGLVDGSTSYQELDEITLLTQNCVTDEEAYPLSYQIFREKVESSVTRYNALTVALAEASIGILGLPAFSGDQNTFVIKVCNDFGSCSSYSLTLDVNAIASFSQEQFDESITNLVDPQKLSSNFLDALVNFNTITSVGVSGSRKRRAVTETSTTAAEQLELLESAISSTVLDTATAQTLLDQSENVVVADLTLADMDTLLDILVDLVAVFSDTELPESSAEIVLTKASEVAAELDPQYNSDMLAKISSLRGTLVQGQLSQISLGGDPIETRTDSLTTRAFYVLPSDTLSTSSDSTAFDVNFGSEIEGLYGASWSCGSGTCSGVQIRFTQYNDSVDYYSTTDDDKNNRAAAILEIDLLDPSDNSELNVTGLSSPVSINMTATRLQSDKVYDCYWWDTDTSSWSQDGLTTIYHSSVESECQTTHLSAFTLIAVDAPTTILATTLLATTMPADDATTSTDGGVSTATTEVSESGNSGLTTTSVIVIAVVVPIVLILIIVIVIGIVMMAKKKPSKIGNADVENTNDNGNGNGGNSGGGGGLAPVESASANQAFGTPTHRPSTAQSRTHGAQVVDSAAAPNPAPVAQEPIRDPVDLPGSPTPPADEPPTDGRTSQNARAMTPVDRGMTPVE